ncbi:MAG: hypothetical protein ABJG88_04145 [Litorimonas sp.]
MAHLKSKIAAEQYHPAGRLVSVLCASGNYDELVHAALNLGRKAASYGETVLMLDCCGGKMMDSAGVVYNKTLKDVVLHGADVRDALYITSNEHFTATAIGDLSLEQSLGSLAALSMSYDWVFVVPPEGCTNAHMRLATTSDMTLLGYGTMRDDFMRAFWLIDAVRRPMPQFDPLVLSSGPKIDAVDTALMLADTVRDHIGAPPSYAGHVEDVNIEGRLITQMRDQMALKDAQHANR